MTNENQKLEIKIPISTIITVLCVLIVVKVAEIISPLFLPLVIAILLAVALEKPLHWLVKKSVPRRYGVGIITLTLALSVLLVVVTIVPSVYLEGVAFAKRIPEFRQEILSNLNSDNPLKNIISHNTTKEVLTPKADQVKEIIGAGNVVLGGFGDLFLIFIFAIYLLADGPRMVKWVSAYFSPATQKKIEQTAQETSEVVSAYVIGQFITSVLSFIFALGVLMALKVPSAPLLAVLAGILDILPVLGFVIAVIPAMLFAAEVSSDTPWMVLGLYILYHLIENYLIIPMIYGNKMKLSSFVVFFTLIAAGLIGGIEGAIAILPLVASYPIIEKIWFSSYLRREVITDHSHQNSK
ncbi:MAG: AI-2E family transporter [Bdellovibrionaceae bacterium]|nr:AI-2E family transporter [Pseudobdellovibrionaceae bacterium]